MSPFPQSDLSDRDHQQIRQLLIHEARADAPLHRRRIALMAPAAAAAVGAVAVGATVLTGVWSGPGGEGSSGPAGQVAASPTVSPSAATSPAPTPIPSGFTSAFPSAPASPLISPTPWTDPSPDAATLAANQVAYPIPDFVAFTAADLPSDQKLGYDDGDYRLQPTVDGQACGTAKKGTAEPIAGRQWMWWAGPGTTAKSHAVTLVVTGWTAGTGAKNFQDVVHDTGLCRWLDPQHVKRGSVAGADQTWQGTETSPNGNHFAHVAVRVGDLIAGISVEDLHSNSAALTTARGLAADVAKDLARVDVTPR